MSAIGSAIRNGLLAADPEWLIGIARLVTAIFAVLAIYLDPTQPTAFVGESQVTLALYVILSMLLVVFPLRAPLDSPVHLVTHLVDLAVLGWLSLLTSELTSPFFSFLPFILLVMTMRWGLWGAIAGAVTLELMQVIVGLPDFGDGDSELNIFIMRSAYFMVAAVMLGYLGAYRERNRQRLTELADWPLEAITGDSKSWLRELFRHAAKVLGEPELLVIWRDHEEEAGSVAFWRNGKLTLVDTRDGAFWDRHDPDASRDPRQFGSADACYREIAAILADLPEIAAMPITTGFACSAPFSSVRYRGRFFVINTACRPDECRPLTEIIATRFGSELERLALMQQTTDAARTEERARLARDLHDSILQDLTAASLRLKVLARSVPEDVGTHLDDVHALMFSQQQRIRQYVEEQRSTDRGRDAALSQPLRALVKILREQWDCEIEVVLDPPDIEVPKWTLHEISQLVSEATANAVRHGKATRLHIALREIDDHHLDLEFCDNGSGVQTDLEPNRPLSLSARVADLDGILTISRETPGFRLRIALPLRTATP